MTFEKLSLDLMTNTISLSEARAEIERPENIRLINYYAHIQDVSKDQVSDQNMQIISAIVNILEILYNSPVGSPIQDDVYDNLQEILINIGIPRQTGAIEINNLNKVSHQFKNLRGTLDKVYYLKPDEVQTNKSRRYLDDWIKSAENKYYQVTGKYINLNDEYVILQGKFDGTSCIMESGTKPLWLTRGDTQINKASDVSHIMNIFNDVFNTEPDIGIKFEVMISEEDKDKINMFYPSKPYKNTRQIVVSILNSNEPDFKVDYLYPVPLRIIHKNESIEKIHPDMLGKFPVLKCKLSDRETIRDFALAHKYIEHNGKHYRTDGVVITLINPEVQRILGRDNDINNFEVAYKFTEDYAYTKVKTIEFETSIMGYICPVVVFHDVFLKGNTVQRASLSNKERFDELDLHYGDEIKVCYDIIPYVIIDKNCRRSPNGRKIEFVNRCPICHSELDLSGNFVRCNNHKCPSRILGRIQNYCNNLRIQNIGSSTLESLWKNGLLEDGILSLYKLKKHLDEISDIEGFGKVKTSKIIREIESKRKLQDYEFFGAIGIENLSIKTFQTIFNKFDSDEFIDIIKSKKYNVLEEYLVHIPGIGKLKTQALITQLQDTEYRNMILKLLKEVTLYKSYGLNRYINGRIVFSGCRPNDDVILLLQSSGYEPSDSWSNNAKYLVVPNDSFKSSKVNRAESLGIPIIAINNKNPIDIISQYIVKK